MLLGAQVLWGVGFGLLSPVWPLFLREIGAAPQDIGLVFGVGNVVAALGFLPAGFLADRIGRKPMLLAAWIISTSGAAAFLPLQDWHGAFIASTTLVFGVRAMPPIAERGRVSFPRTFWTLLGVAPVGALLSIVSIALLPLYLREIAAVPLERVGVYVALVALGAAVLAPAAGRLADGIGAVPALIGAATVLTIGAGLIALSGRSEPLIVVAALLLGATQAANPVLAAAVERIIPPARIALGYATYQLAFAIGFGSGGAVAGFLYEADPLLPFLVTVALALPVAAVIGLVIARAVTPQSLPIR